MASIGSLASKGRGRYLPAVLMAALLLPALPSPAAHAQSDGFFFSDTGKTVRGEFLRYWSTHGGTPQQGLPISDEMQERSDVDGKTYTVQYFERAVFELHPGNQTPYNVLLSLLGVSRYKEKYPAGSQETPNTSPGARLFPETGKRVGCQFLDYWERHGGLAQFGYPISGELTEVSDFNGKPYLVQYFQRAVLEYHLEGVYTAPATFLTTIVPQIGTLRFQATHPSQLPAGVPAPAPVGATGCIATGHGPSFGDQIDDAPVRSSVGTGHVLHGVVRSSKDCSPVANAKIIFWLAGPDGQYDDAHRASVFTGRDGAYRFESNFPAFYGAGGPHIHLYLSADGYRSIETELFVFCDETEGVFDAVLAPNP